MSQILIETYDLKINSQTLNESIKRGGNLIINEVLLATAEQKNGNGRYYPRELWERELKRYNEEAISKRNSMGELDHPDSTVINLKNASHLIKEIKWDGDKVLGSIEVLPTPSGNIVKALLESGVTIGVSSRGMGSLKQVGEVAEVQDDFSLLCWDIVSTPSNPGSWMKPTTINESLQLNKNPYSNLNSIITDILCSNGTCPIW
jgi:hypothetical protein